MNSLLLSLPKILAYLRRYETEIILCVANLSETAQAALLELAEYDGCTPVSLFGGSFFPSIGSVPYQITLAGHSFFWLKLLGQEELQERRTCPLEAMDQPDLPPPPFI